MRTLASVLCGALAAAAVSAAPFARTSSLTASGQGAPPAAVVRELSSGSMRTVFVRWPVPFVPPVVQSAEVFPQSVASGDPHSDSVILWTRAVDPAAPGTDVKVRAVVTADRFFHKVVYNKVVTAAAGNDNCVKLKVSGLDPDTIYYYFFIVNARGSLYVSRPGRTRTAPAAGSTRAVRFAYVNCEDYVGRYYNTYLELLLTHADDIDFVVELGDYIYETDGDPSFQHPEPGREVAFTDLAGTIELGPPGETYHAASSLSNYRQLYRIYRSDPMLQRVHESFPMIAIWDDHEYSDDCWGATATYFDGRIDEYDPVRRRHAEQAFFEYIPIDWGLDAKGELAITDAVLYPNARIYRDFHFGSTLHLLMTDYRSFRPDHIIPEDAFPGTVVLDRAVLEAMLTPAGYAANAASFDPYVDIDTLPEVKAGAVAIATGAYLQANPFFSPPEAAAKAQEVVAGALSATYLNGLFEAAGMTAPFDTAAMAAMDRGVSYLYVGKRDLYSSTGSRYILVKPTFDLVAAYSYLSSGGASQDAYGAEQDAWIAQALASSGAAWRVFSSSVSMTPMILDFTNPDIAALLPPGFPDAFRTTLLINADQWDGFPQRLAQLTGTLGAMPNTVVIAGDIHASFVSDHRNGLYEFTGPAVSSSVLGYEVLRQVMADPQLSQVPGIDGLVQMVGPLLQASSLDPAVSPAAVVSDDAFSNGFVIMEVDPDRLTATYYLIDAVHTPVSYYDDPTTLESLFTTRTFTVENGQLQEEP